MQLILSAALNTQHDETQIRRLDAGVVEAVGDGLRRLRSINPVSLETAKTFLLDRDDNPVAFQQAGGAVMRGANAKNPRCAIYR
jgi:hypothetical protein